MATITVSTVLVHGTADSDVRPEQSENAAAHIPNAEVIRVKNGTHLCAWTDPTSADVQERIASVLSGPSARNRRPDPSIVGHQRAAPATRRKRQNARSGAITRADQR
jgi:hypothetical protein